MEVTGEKNASMESATSVLVFYVNGKKVVEKDADPETTLLQYLRTKLHLTGTKLGCGEGGCGACTVMVSRYDSYRSKIQHFSANACLLPVCSVHSMAVTTVEGIGSVKNGLHPVQERLAKSHGSQCGFCTPGIIMSMYTLLRNNPQPGIRDMEKTFEGNLCRCTGYRPIIDGLRTFTKEYCQMGDQCCRSQVKGDFSKESGLSTELYDKSEFTPLDPTQDPIFPPELQTNTSYDSEDLYFCGERVKWYRPTTLIQLLKLKQKYPKARLVIGNTEVGVETKLKNMHYPVLIAATHIPELNEIREREEGVRLGASVTLSQVEEVLKECLEKYSEYKTRVFQAVIEMLRWFAGSQIRNVAAIGGNIITASPISDLNPLFLAAGAKLEVISSDGGRRKITMDDKFFLGYRKTALNDDEILLSITLPFTRKHEYFFGYKQAYRREDDIATVNAGMRVLFEENTNVVKEMALAFGGMAPTTVMAKQTMNNVVGRSWEDDLVQDICHWLADDLPLAPGAPGGMVEYRRTLTSSFFFKFYLTVQIQLQTMHTKSKSRVPSSYKSATSVFYRDPPKSSQIYDAVASGQPPQDPVGRVMPHVAAIKHVTGEAIYVDDMPRFENELYLAFVLSTKSHADIVSVDTSEAFKVPGVVDYISEKDIPGAKMYGIIIHDDDYVFAIDKVTTQGQVIGAVVADTQAHAQLAAKLVKVEYREHPAVITIKDAIEANSYYLKPKTLHTGNVDQAFAQCDHILEGEAHVGGQEHFYLETQTTLAVPKNEDGEMELFISTQNPSEAQLIVAEVLGVPANRILVRVKRLGGGFGGKESRFLTITLPTAVAAHKLGRPVRVSLDRDQDMLMTGTRHPFLGRYKVGFTKQGKILALQLELYNNAGNSIDLSPSVLDRAIFHCENSYKIPNLKVTGYLCKTNTPSNTAFRGFGGPQAMLIAEQWLTDVAFYLGISPVQVREINLYQENDLTHFNMPLEKCNIRRCWDECITQSDYHRRRKEVDIFNSENRWKKRGITVVPTKFGLSYTAVHLNQAGALVHIYKDGSVLLTHGGVEMGQGLHTKMIQVASRCMHIPQSKIFISETGTNTVPNTSATAASVSSDINGMAIIDACTKIMERLEPVMRENPKATWEEWIGFDFATNTGRPFLYFTYGAACSEVELDCLTGDHQVLKTDIVMDVGVSLNPAIDIGQIEGGFIQGYGLMMMEQQKMSPTGYLFTRGPGTYKIPGFGDIPVEFNVSLLKGSVNKKAVYSSKVQILSVCLTVFQTRV
ncbi:hypothetical protein ACJMK2_037715 [Sinanodonta woodiana]|uniref:xanthine dehydrogenase n=1 Tax=Sinanodonta woodiana TaxID=1069815 RepID=A0ABD3WLA0_SINWO